ncbi:MAG: ABC transporter permease [Chloroflexi bacterium]|nr:ABC transporter permease [Chloroflexota bacterium]
MKFFAVFRKTLREMSRDKWMLGLTVAFAPFFVLLYWLITAGGSTTYTILTINNDKGIQLADGTRFNAGQKAVAALKRVTYGDGQPILKPLPAANRAEAEPILRNRGAAAFILIPENFSQMIQNLQSGNRSATTQIIFGGDVSNPYYMVGVNLSLTAIDGYVLQATGQQPLIQYTEEPLGASAARTEFKTYVPGTLVFAVILLIFLASMTVAREIETGTLRRLQLTPMTSMELLGGITAALVLIGTAAFGLAFVVALIVGFRSQGPLWAAILVGAVTCLSVIGLGMVVASFTRTVSHAFVVANFPLGLMMFFSGVIYPLPKVTLFHLFGHEIGLYDFLPPTHAVAALNKILTLGTQLDQVVFELSALILLSVLYFAVGVWLFKRFHLQS